MVDASTSLKPIPHNKRCIKPWMTPGLLRCIKHRNKLHYKTNKDPYNITLKITYKRYRNHCNNILKKVKREYDQEQLQKAGKDNKRLWKTIKSIANIDNTKTPSELLLNTHPNPTESINYDNNYFATIGRDLAKKITDITHTIKPTKPTYLKTYPQSFAIEPTDEIEVRNIISQLSNSNTTGWDNISARILKASISNLLPILTHLFNFSKCSKMFHSSTHLQEWRQRRCRELLTNISTANPVQDSRENNQQKTQGISNQKRYVI